MNLLSWRVLRRLVYEPHLMSRNRYPDSFADPVMARMRRRAARLRSLRALLQHSPVSAVHLLGTDSAGRVRLRVDLQEGSGQQTSWLSSLDLAVLGEDPELRGLLAACGGTWEATSLAPESDSWVFTPPTTSGAGR